MADTGHSQHEPSNPSTTFEESDVNVRGVFISGMVLGVVSVAIMVLMLWLFDHYARQTAGAPEGASLTTAPWRSSRAPELEGLPSSTEKTQSAIDASHVGYGWVDRRERIAHIPIEDAIKLLPSMFPAPPPASDNTPVTNKRLAAERSHPPGPSSSGRIVLRNDD